jgi:hypothetical protein
MAEQGFKPLGHNEFNNDGYPIETGLAKNAFEQTLDENNIPVDRSANRTETNPMLVNGVGVGIANDAIKLSAFLTNAPDNSPIYEGFAQWDGEDNTFRKALNKAIESFIQEYNDYYAE